MCISAFGLQISWGKCSVGSKISLKERKGHRNWCWLSIGWLCLPIWTWLGSITCTMWKEWCLCLFCWEEERRIFWVVIQWSHHYRGSLCHQAVSHCLQCTRPNIWDGCSREVSYWTPFHSQPRRKTYNQNVPDSLTKFVLWWWCIFLIHFIW